jgi:hypothetical protein
VLRKVKNDVISLHSIPPFPLIIGLQQAMFLHIQELEFLELSVEKGKA